jgi:hypothetical protein
MGAAMRDRWRLTTTLVVLGAVAFICIVAIGSHWQPSRAAMIAVETVIEPTQPLLPNAEYRLSDQQQLLRIFLRR